MRESIVYTVENAQPGQNGAKGEAIEFLELLRQEAERAYVQAGAVQKVNGSLQTASGRPLSGAAAEGTPVAAPEPVTAVPETATSAPAKAATAAEGVTGRGVSLKGAGSLLASLAPTILTSWAGPPSRNGSTKLRTCARPTRARRRQNRSSSSAMSATNSQADSHPMAPRCGNTSQVLHKYDNITIITSSIRSSR